MGKQGKTKSWSQPQWRLWQGARRHQAGWQDGWPSGDSAGYQQFQGYEPYVNYAADKTQTPGFPAYDLARPGQHITVIQESRSQAGQAGYSLVQEVQAAVNQARKTETKLIRLQKEKTKKEQMWVQYAKDMQAAFTKERARHIANINKLQQDIQDTQALVVEDQQRVQNAAAGCFRGMAGSTEAQQEWDALISENQQGPDDAPMSNKDLYSMLVRCAQAASASVAAGAEPPSTGPLRDGTNAPVAAGPDMLAAPGPATVPPEALPVPGMAPAPGYMPASPGPALRESRFQHGWCGKWGTEPTCAATSSPVGLTPSGACQAGCQWCSEDDLTRSPARGQAGAAPSCSCSLCEPWTQAADAHGDNRLSQCDGEARAHPSRGLRFGPGPGPRPRAWRFGGLGVASCDEGAGELRHTQLSLGGPGGLDSKSAWGAGLSHHCLHPIGYGDMCCELVWHARVERSVVGLMYSRSLFLGDLLSGKLCHASPGNHQRPFPIQGRFCLRPLTHFHPLPPSRQAAQAFICFALVPPSLADFGSFVEAFGVSFPNVPNSCIGGSGTTTKGEHTFSLLMRWLLHLGAFLGSLELSLWGIAAMSVWQLILNGLPVKHTPLGRLLCLPTRGIPRSAVCALAKVGSVAGPVNWKPWTDRKGRVPRRSRRPSFPSCGILWLLCMLDLPCLAWSVPTSYRTAVSACQALASVLPEHFEDLPASSPHDVSGLAVSDDSWALPPAAAIDRSVCQDASGAVQLQRGFHLNPDPNAAPWLGAILHCPFYQQQTWAVQIDPALGSEHFFDQVLNHMSEVFHPHIDSVVAINPQRHDGYAMLLYYPSALDHLSGMRQIAVILDLSRVGGHYHAAIVPAAMSHHELQERVREHVFCDVDQIDVYVAEDRTPWQSGTVTHLDHGDVLTVVAAGGSPPFLHFFEDLFAPGHQWGALEHIPRRILTPAVRVLHDAAPFTLVGHHFPRQSVSSAIAQVLAAEERALALATSRHFWDFDDWGAPCDRCVAVHRWPRPLTEAEAMSFRVVYTFCDLRPLGRHPQCLVSHSFHLHIPTLVGVLDIQVPRDYTLTRRWDHCWHRNPCCG